MMGGSTEYHGFGIFLDVYHQFLLNQCQYLTGYSHLQIGKDL